MKFKITIHEIMSTKTKCIVLGGEAETKKELKPIELFRLLNIHGLFVNAETSTKASSYENIELISLGYSSDFDLIFAHNSNRKAGELFLGKWNDGVVS